MGSRVIWEVGGNGLGGAAVGSGIDNKAAAAEKSDEGEAEFAGELDRKARGRGDRGEDGQAGGEGLLDDLKAAATAHQQEMLRKRQHALKQRCANDLVDGVVAAYIFAEQEETAVGVEECGGVQSTGLAEDGLRGAKLAGQCADHFRAHGKARTRSAQAALTDGVDRGLAADAATGGGEEVALHLSGIEFAVAQFDFNRVVFAAALRGLGAEAGELAEIFDEAFGEEEAGGEFSVMAGSAHGDSERVAVDADFKGFFDSERVVIGAGEAVVPLDDWGELDAALGGIVRTRVGPWVGHRINYISSSAAPGVHNAERRWTNWNPLSAQKCYKVFMTKRKSTGPQPGQTISLRTLGEYLNLSPATISLVLNNAAGVRSIPQETRERVREAAKLFDYRPSFYARSLRKGQTFSVGVLVPDLTDGYVAQVLEGVEDVLMEEGYFYFIASHRRRADLLEEYPRLLLSRSVEGFIVIDTMLEHELSVPVVAVAGHRKFPGVTNVVLDQVRAAELILRHLYQLGHRKIGFMRGGSHSSDADERWECLMKVARELKLAIRPEWLVQLELKISTPELGYMPTVDLLNARARLDEQFTALVCYNDIAAIGAIRAMREQHIRVPEDISVVGFDDIQAAAFQNPSLTTIRQPLRSMGATAAKILLRRIRAQGSDPDTVPIIPELVIRESTAPPKVNRGKRSASS